jgi:hypothetical protein
MENRPSFHHLLAELATAGGCNEGRPVQFENNPFRFSVIRHRFLLARTLHLLGED